MPGSPARRVDALSQEQKVVDLAHARRDGLLGELDQQLRQDMSHERLRHAGPADAVDAMRATALRRRRAELLHADNGLVFGRLDAVDGSSHHVGRVGLPGADEESAPLVLDWRAPAARPFYTATPLDPQGQRRRRHIRTDGREVTGVDDEPLDEDGELGDLVGEGALLTALSARRTGHMGTAIATLQREQDDVVRAATNGPLVVQGGPGTGKTVVALHRIAYLLFSRPELAGQGVLVLGPSRRFLDYIEQVLPALGETAVVSATCATLVPGIEAHDEESRELAELKGRGGWMSSLTAHVHSLVPAAAVLAFVIDGERHTLPVSRIRRALEAAVPGRSLHGARRRFIESVHDMLTDAVVERHEELLSGVEDGFEDILARLDAGLARSDNRGVLTGATGVDVDGALTDEDIERLHAQIVADPDVAAVLEEFWPLRDARRTLQAFLADEQLLRQFAPWLEDHERSLVTGAAMRLAPGDVALLDAVAELVGTAESTVGQGEFLAETAAARRDWAYGHVVVDEAQELSAMQWHMVARRVPSRSITAVGDVDQAETPHRHTTWEEAMTPVFGTRWRRSDLTICYRTPREVMALTGPVLAEAGSRNQPPRALRDSGFEPWEASSTERDLAQTVAKLVETMKRRWAGGTVGVVAPTSRVAALRRGLPGAVVLAAAEAKGLEWDAALVVDPDGITAEPRGWNSLYVAMTRCTQELGRVHCRPHLG